MDEQQMEETLEAMPETTDEQQGYELSQIVGAERDFLEKLVPILWFICRPMEDRKKMRVVVDYDPHKKKVKFRYYSPSDGQDGTECQ